MEQYISKSALLAEIEKRISEYENCGIDNTSINAKIIALQGLLIYIKAFEVKEVDLEKEYKDFVEEDPVYNKLVNGIVGKAIAKHFYSLGLAQKGEEV